RNPLHPEILNEAKDLSCANCHPDLARDLSRAHVILSEARDLGATRFILSEAKDLPQDEATSRSLVAPPQDDTSTLTSLVVPPRGDSLEQIPRLPSLRSRTGSGWPRDDAQACSGTMSSASSSDFGCTGTLVTTKPGVNSSDSFRNCADCPCSRCCHQVSGTYSGSTTVTVSAFSWRRSSARNCRSGRVRLRYGDSTIVSGTPRPHVGHFSSISRASAGSVATCTAMTSFDSACA